MAISRSRGNSGDAGDPGDLRRVEDVYKIQDVARIFQSLERLSHLVFGKAELRFKISGGTLEHIAVEVLPQQRLTGLVQRLVRAIPVDDLGQDDDGGQVRLTRLQHDVLIPLVRNNVSLKVDFSNFYNCRSQ